MIIDFLNKFQKKGVDPILLYNHAELYFNQDHHVTLSLVKFVTTEDERKFLLKVTIKRTNAPNEASNLEPSSEACKEVLLTIQKSFEPSKDGGRRGIQYERCILCDVCSDGSEKKHIQNLGDFQDEKLPCTKTRKYLRMDVARYKRLFGESNHWHKFAAVAAVSVAVFAVLIGCGIPAGIAGVVTLLLVAAWCIYKMDVLYYYTRIFGGCSDEDQNESTSSSHQSQPREGFSEDDFKQLIADFAKWFDDRGLLNRLQVLFIEIVDDIEAVKRVTSTTELLALLTANGQLSQTNLSVLYDAIKVTAQFGFESVIKEKLRPFKNIKKRKVASFSSQTKKIFNLGKSLSDSDKETLDVRYNFPVVKGYTDSWSLILDFVPRGLLSEDKIDEVNKLLKRN
ncbi:uncharacterized protein [Antedon mediterranea]|uniref:uncharacterized protein n=1 Tax=Antedon mediterranea TaxID=105859 RepID=UPI003AF5A4F1